MAYYYVPLEQIKRGKDLNKKETYLNHLIIELNIKKVDMIYF